MDEEGGKPQAGGLADRAMGPESTYRRSWKSILLGGPGLVLLGLLLVLAGAGALRWATPPQAKPAEKLSAARDARPLLESVYPDLQGRPQPFKQWEGRVLVVNYWATWCGPCRDEIPDLVRLQGRLAQEAVTIVGLAIDQTEPVRSFVEEFSIGYPILVGGFPALDSARAAGNTYAVLPFTVIIDRQGRIAEAHLGRISAERLETMIRQALR